MSRPLVVVAMSGGVDSAVAAALLKEQGYDVYGVTMKLWCYQKDAPDAKACCSMAAISEARATAQVLGIEYAVLDLEEQFEAQVIGPFAEAYRTGQTPNPCVNCNTFIKFGTLLEKARRLGAQYVATGHYAQMRHTPEGPEMWRGVDADKDQSYALWGLNRAHLGEVLMPVGALTKSEVRAKAHEFQLPVADKAESMDICFTEGGHYADFLLDRFGHFAQAEPGPMVDSRGRVVGTHQGVMRYTVGQRKGLGLARPEPTYVVGIDAATNTLTVGDESELFSHAFEARALNFVSIDPPAEPFEALVRVRHRGRRLLGRVTPLGGGRARIDLETPERAITPGQSAVFYDGDRLIGGALIEGPLKDEAGGASATLATAKNGGIA